ncbi:MAG: type II toxin-antitoxin system prevent-host-death family antitoxin [Pirellulales bacterium]
MAIDFTPLPMTELRNRPGEILDRVADGGESFVIERNGHQKACLVPLSVFLPDISSSRIAQEIKELEKAGESSRTTVTSEREIAFTFRGKADGSPYDITIVLPHRYPSVCPRVYVDPVESAAPHRFADGALCIFGVMSSWNPGKHSALVALQNARTWIRHYEHWRKTSQWPSPGVNDAT